jgi:hypothetical protein
MTMAPCQQGWQLAAARIVLVAALALLCLIGPGRPQPRNESSVRNRYHPQSVPPATFLARPASSLNRAYIERACRAVRSSCRLEEGTNATKASSTRAHPGVKARLRDLAGKWHFDLDTVSRFPSLNYSADGVRPNWRCSGDAERARRYQQALWIPDGCRSLSDMDFVKPFLVGKPLDFLPPNVTAVSIGNSYLSQMTHSLVYRAWKMGQVQSVCDLKPTIFDLPLDSIKALAPTVDDLCRSDDSPFVAGFHPGGLEDIVRPTSDQIVTLTNGARIYVAYNSRMQFLDAHDMLQLAAMFVRRDSIAGVDIVLVNTGNSIKHMIRIAGPCGKGGGDGHGDERAACSPPCAALTAKLTRLAIVSVQQPLDLGKIPTLNVSDIMQELGIPKRESTVAPARTSGPGPAHGRSSQVVLVAPHNSQGIDYDEGIREAFPDNFFHFGGVFKSNADTCESDNVNSPCSRGWRHQCMPGPPDSMSDALRHVVWEEFCEAAALD